MAILSTPLQYVTSIPLATRVFTALMVVVPVVYSWLDMRSRDPRPLFTAVPGVILYTPWTVLTALFVETNIISWLFSIMIIVPALRYFERLWGAVELAKFVLITGVISNIIAVALAWLEATVLGYAEFFLTESNYFGMTAVQTGILVAFTQLIPEHQVQLLGVIRIRVKRLPMIYVTISTVLCLVGYPSPWILIQFGWLVSWTYLRFYKKNGSESGSADTYGDRSETFAFVYWFPPFLHVPLNIVFNAAHNGAVKLHIVRPFAAGSPDIEAGLLPGGARAEAERRRAMALKALDQRLQNANAASGSTAAPVAAAPAAPTDDESAPMIQGEDGGKGKGKAVEPAES
ncbi:DUF1751-domain-containing protein [Exidia glandulosa HHB12029]|uniref:DUF1751-domain-containing protein n=1 Tax=Exidia glandulosa HHB12029 TaxID=1314781 RepID=A0A165MC53_EXIGL|nr:DUF1751-domain-containing protein [Exidia glandulosa HHB12029]